MVELALSRGHHVTTVSRRPARLKLRHPNLIIQKADITILESMTSVIPGHDVVISTVGLSAGKRNVTVFSDGIANVLNVMLRNNQRRLIALSAIGAGDSKGHGGFLFDSILQPLILDDDIEDKTRMEEQLKLSEIDYTVIRPAILSNQPAGYQYHVLTDLEQIETGTISREDVAHFIMAIAEQNTYLRQIVTLSD